MQKAESQHGQAQNQPAAQRGGRAGVESSGSGKIAQLEAMIAASPQMAAQRMLIDTLHNSPVVQRLVAGAGDKTVAVPVYSPQTANAKDSYGPCSHDFKGGVIQGRFAGTFGAILSALTPSALGASDTYYHNLWTALDASATEIAVEDAGGFVHFDPATNTLNLRPQILQGLLDHRSGKHVLDPDVLADHVALITHELSHAHDSVIRGQELKGEKGAAGPLDKIANVMMTEVLAWEREARTRQQLKHGGDDPLWEGWVDLESDMLADYAALEGNRGTNEVVGRYYRYLRRELNSAYGDINIHQIDAWFVAHGAAISAEMIRLSTDLRRARNSI